MDTMFGIQIIEDPLIPEKVQAIRLSDNAPVSDEFREKFNSWLLERFGEKTVAVAINPRAFGGPIGGLMREPIAMNPATAMMLRIKCG